MAFTQSEKEHINAGIALRNFADRLAAEISAGALDAGSVSTTEIADDAVTMDKLVNVAQGSIIIGGANSAPTVTDVKTDAQLLVGNGTTIASVPVTGDISIDNAGLTTIQADSVQATMINADVAGQGIAKASDGSLGIKAGGDVNLFMNSLILAEEIRTDMDAHAADGLRHTTGVDNVNFPLTSPAATDLASLIVLVTEILDEFEDHLDDNDLGVGWSFHAAQGTDYSLATVVPPTTLVQCISILNDVKSKFNSHEADAGSHGGATTVQVSAADASDILELGLLSVDTGQLAADAVTAAKIEDNAVSLEHLDAGITPSFICVGAVANDTMSREENVAGLSSAITLANSLKSTINTHYADQGGGGEEHISADTPIANDDATDLATLITLTSEMQDSYVAHDDDAILGGAWVYHQLQGTERALASAVNPTTLETAVTVLNDLKAKFNLHEGDGVSHTNGDSGDEAADNAAYGAANLVPEANALAGDIVNWSILDSGTGTVVGVSAVAGTAGITFTFDADPQNDCIISYSVFRTAV